MIGFIPLKKKQLTTVFENAIINVLTFRTTMFSVLKFFWLVSRSSWNIMNPNLNPLRHAPVYVKFFLSVLLSCFWCLAFGLYIGELLTIGYNMIGHIAIITMVFATWAIFRTVEDTYAPRKGVQWLRAPDHASRCDELTEDQRLASIARADQILKSTV